MVSLVRVKRFAQKRESRYFVAHIKEGTDPHKGQIPATSGQHFLGNLPENAIVTDAYVHVVVGGNAATTAVGTIGTASGGGQILTAANLKVTGKTGTFAGQSLTTTGKELWFNQVLTGAATAAGEFLVVVEYLEYEMTNGEYTLLDEPA